MVQASLLLLLLLLLLVVTVSRAEWVEIPHLKPATAGSTISTTIKPAASVGGGHVQLFLSHLSDGPAGSPSVRWVPAAVSDLLDYEAPGRGGAVSSPPWITAGQVVPPVGDTNRLVNVSSKVESEEAEEEQEEEEEYVEEEEEEEQAALLPFGNRYEEESIETVTAPKAIQPATHHYDDFDDYDERMQPAPGHDQDEEEEEEEEEEYQVELEKAGPVEDHRQSARPVVAGGFGGFVDFLRRMQASFVQRTARTIGDKIRTLAGMRDQLLRTIERRIATLWHGGAGRRRHRRVKRGGGWMEPHGGTDAMDFPSAEGALLTISFLTFAVFLIKLVLQVINTIKAKHYTYSTFAAATPVSGGVLVKRTRRHTDHHQPDHVRVILRTIEGAGYRHL